MARSSAPQVPSQPSASTERRAFTLDQNAIRLLIQSQAGSLQKALMEAVSNSLDAGATRISVDLSSSRVVLEDDGRGFRTRKELADYFERWGFDHEGLDRQVGRFGVGRGQLFNFGHSLWTTNGFTMDVDVKSDMFGYVLGKASTPFRGVRIEISLYESLGYQDMSRVEKEFRSLVKYCPIPVLLNGTVINQPPQDLKWELETEDAWYSLDPESHYMHVYSQGFFVQSIYASRYGQGGTVVTKPGFPLEQNMARNDLLAASCPVWKRVDAKLRALATEIKRSDRKPSTEASRHMLAQGAIYGDSVEDALGLIKEPIFTLTNGRHVRLGQVLSPGFVSSSEMRDHASDLLIQRKQASVVSRSTLLRFGVETATELKACLSDALTRHWKAGRFSQLLDYRDRHSAETSLLAIPDVVFEDAVSVLPFNTSTDLNEISPREATPDERLLLSVLRKSAMAEISALVHNRLNDGDRVSAWTVKLRSLRLCQSSDYRACTDGVNTIWFARETLADAIKGGPAGFSMLVNVLVHELVHTVDSSGAGHGHDHDFFEAYHDLTLTGEIGEIALKCYRTWLRMGGKASMNSVALCEATQVFTPADADVRRGSGSVAKTAPPVVKVWEDLTDPVDPDFAPAGAARKKPSSRAQGKVAERSP